MYPTLSLYRGGGGVPRPPLPPPPPGVYTRLPYGGSWAGSTYQYVDPPAIPVSRDFLIADAWGITLPDVPVIPGGSSNPVAKNRILSWFFARYPADIQQQWLDQNVANGNTHAIVSPPDDIQGFGLSLQQTLDAYGRIKQRIPYVHAMLGSKVYQPWNMSAQQYLDYALPLLDALIAAQVVDEVCPGWEWDIWNEAGQTTIDIFRGIGQRAHAAGVSSWFHGSPHVTWWGQDGTDRYRFWNDLGSDCDGLDYQGDSAWAADEWQARIVDTLHQFGEQGNVHKIRAFERMGTRLFDNPTPTEADANLDGYLSLCTIDDVKHTSALVWGSGQGPCYLDGRPLSPTGV